MKLKVIGSSSRGNGYALIADDEILLIEAGCKLIEVKKAIDWQIGKVVGCLVSHRHGDHAAHIKEYMKNGITVYGGEDTAADIEECGGERIKPLPPKHKTGIGRFVVQPFPLIHDCPCNGFLVTHPDMGRLVFATDTEYVKYRFGEVNHILIEANYSKGYLDESEEGIEKRRHVLQGHMSVEAAEDFVRANASYDLRNVVLIHLSDHNGDPAGFREKIATVVDCQVMVAEPGLEVELKAEPF